MIAKDSLRSASEFADRILVRHQAPLDILISLSTVRAFFGFTEFF
jgi:hypothetical protein